MSKEIMAGVEYRMKTGNTCTVQRPHFAENDVEAGFQLARHPKREGCRRYAYMSTGFWVYADGPLVGKYVDYSRKAADPGAEDSRFLQYDLDQGQFLDVIESVQLELF